MSTNHARDDWADARTDEALRRGLDALAGAGAAASTLDGALGSVRRRVRRRRTAKQAGIGATTLAVAAGLVLGGAALLPDAPQPLPGPATSPTPTPSPSSSPSASGATSFLPIEAGYQPSWLEGTDLVCGMRFEDLPANAAGRRLDLLAGPVLDDDTSADGTETVQTWRAPTRLTVEDPADAGLRVSAPSLLWTEGPLVVDVGVDTTEAGMDQVGDAPAERDAEDSTLTTCAPEATAQDGAATDVFTSPLRPGEYQVRAVVQLWSPDFTDVELVVSEPVTVTLGDPTDGADAASSAAGTSDVGATECSARGLDLPEPDVADLPEAVQVTVHSLFDAARACDDERLVALAEAADRVDDNWGGPPREAFTLPAAEADDDVYATLARMLSGTRSCAVDGPDRTLHVWPVMNGNVCAATRDEWNAAAAAGAITDREAAAMDADAYDGWSLAIDEDGTWEQFTDTL